MRTLYKSGKATTLEEELYRYKIDIAALQEIRWPGTGKTQLDKGYVLYSGKDNNRHEEGVGFYLSRKAYSAIEEFEAISSRIAKIRLNARWFKVTVLSLHAPTEESEESVKDAWYSQVQEVLRTVPGHDMLIMLGDYNAKVGREVCAFQGTIGKHSLHETSNDNGIRLASLALQQNLVIGGTIFPHKDTHKGTWISPDGNTINQIDHILVKRKFRSSLLDTRTYRGADCDSDHMLVVGSVRMKLKTSKSRVTRSLKPRVDLLQKTQIREQYQLEMTNRFSLLEEENLDIGWEEVKTVINETAQEILGTTRQERRAPWFDNECKEAAANRRKCRREWIDNRQDDGRKEAYRMARNIATGINRRKKREELEGRLQEIEGNREQGKTRLQFQGIKKIRNGYQPRNDMIKDKHGKLLTTKEEVTARWVEHFQELLNRPEPEDPITEDRGGEYIYEE